MCLAVPCKVIEIDEARAGRGGGAQAKSRDGAP